MLSPFDKQIAGRTLWQEARGEPLAGQIAVADVFVNRLKSGRWGKSLAEVCLWRNQFSGWLSSDANNYGPSIRLAEDDPLLAKLTNIVETSFNGPDTTRGALFYYAVWLKPIPLWATKMFVTCTIGKHIFLTDKADGNLGHQSQV